MKILIDIGHPAHVHYFRNLIKIFEQRGHKFLVIAKKRAMIIDLLNYYKISYILRKNYPKNILGKLFSIPFTDLFILWQAIKFWPDVLLGFTGTHISHAGFILHKSSIVFDDTDHARLAHLSYVPFASLILTPMKFRKDFGSKHIRFNGTMDLCYLHPEYFQPDPEIINMIGINKDEKYIFIRFVKWSSTHDLGHRGLSIESQIKIVENLSRICKVFISSEIQLPKELQPYEIMVSPEKIHDVLKYASLFLGESGTMASESCLLGTPSINTATSAELIGVFEDFVSAEMMYIITDPDKAITKAVELLNDPNAKINMLDKAQLFMDNHIDVIKMMVWLIENHPSSLLKIKRLKTIMNNKDYLDYD